MKNFYLIVPKMALNYKFMKHTNSINNYEELV